ncbi:flavin reductase family protein [Pseudonocardia sp. CA-107938]|uniref:flavin reductase family protein n=1 Tax=Pseudonocardia sp. CA-107938 TaxID=3240021 RepID=UPI003D8E5523
MGTELEPAVSPERLRTGFGCFPTGVLAICALRGGEPVGMAASSFTSVSLSPPLVSVCIQHTSTTWPVLRGAPRVGLTVLAEQQSEHCARLASRSGDRFAGVAWTATSDGAVFIDGGALWLDCAIEREIRAGDHDLVLLRVLGLRSGGSQAPLVFHGSRFRRLATS